MTKPVTETPAAPTAEQQRVLVERILASVLFRKSHKLAAFLKFICEQQQMGKADSINEQRIGTEVFGRSEGYHMGEDSIVRSQARFLRLRLQEYFATEGRSEPIVLTIPKGSYVPEFHFREAVPELHEKELGLPAALEVLAVPKPEGHDGQPRLLGRRILIGGLVVALCFAVALMVRFWPGRSTKVSTVESRFWASIFDPQRTTLIVTADSSLILIQEITGQEVAPADYINRRYLEGPPPKGMERAWSALRNSQYTNMADLNLVSRLERLPEAAQGKIQIRFARDVNIKGLKENNTILIGGARSDPWVGLFDSYAHLRVDYDPQKHVNFVLNRQPGAGEQDRYEEVGEGSQHTAYGVVAYLPSLDREGSALLVGGTSKAGTEAAGEFLFSNQFVTFLRSMESGGRLSRFEILLSTQNLNGDSYNGTIVCFHRLADAPLSR